MDSNPIYDYNNNDENRSQSSLGFSSDSDEFTGVVQVVIWENGKTAKNTFTIEIILKFSVLLLCKKLLFMYYNFNILNKLNIKLKK